MKANTKEWVQYSSAIAMIVSGIVLAFLSFFMKGDVTDGVLLYLAQALTFAGGVFGLTLYFRNKLGVAEVQAKEYIDRQIDERERRYRRAHHEEDNTEEEQA